MKTFILLSACSLSFFLLQPAQAVAPLERSQFYSLMKSDDVTAMDNLLVDLEKDSSPDSKAYQGAMLMKKAGLVKGPFKKLKLFKEGHKRLEEVLQQNKDNVEYRFLRLMIQENAPGIVNYKSNLQEDTSAILSAFKTLPTDLQKAIRDYSESSKILTPASLQK